MSRSLWITVLCGGLIMCLTLGLRQGLGLFLTPISLELDGSRATFALGLGLMNLAWGAVSPFAGAVADKYGAGRVAAAGGLFYAGGLGVMTLSGDGTQLLVGGTLIGIGLSGAGFSVILGTVGRAAPPEKRGLALGLASTFGSFGQFAALPYIHMLIGDQGWVAAMLILVATVLVVVPLAFGLAGRPAEGAAPSVLPTQDIGAAIREAWGHRGFRLLNAGFFVCGFHLAFIGVHLPAYLADQGFDPWLAATALTVVGLCNIFGSYLFGLLGDVWTKKNVLCGLYAARTVAILAFILLPVSEVSVLVFAAVMGTTWLGTVPLTSGLVATIFGTTYMSLLFGMVFLGHQLGGFLGAWLAGLVYDLAGSYGPVWWASVGLGVMSVLLHWPIEEKPVARMAPAV